MIVFVLSERVDYTEIPVVGVYSSENLAKAAMDKDRDYIVDVVQLDGSHLTDHPFAVPHPRAT